MDYKLNKPHPRRSNGKGYITKDGHTMLQQDIVSDLRRIENLEMKVDRKTKHVDVLKAENEKLIFMIKNGLGFEDLKDDITYPPGE